MATITNAMRKASQTPTARRRRVASAGRVARYKRMHDIPYNRKLTAAQLAEAHNGHRVSPGTSKNFPKGAKTVSGAMDLSALRRAVPKPKPGPRATPARYVTAARVALGHDLIKLVDRLTHSGKAPQHALARDTVGFMLKLLNGGGA